MDRVCGNCRSFNVLDDASRHANDWFGVCAEGAREALGVECGTLAALDWIYDNGRHGQDGCERPDEWFEEDTW